MQAIIFKKLIYFETIVKQVSLSLIYIKNKSLYSSLQFIIFLNMHCILINLIDYYNYISIINNRCTYN